MEKLIWCRRFIGGLEAGLAAGAVGVGGSGAKGYRRGPIRAIKLLDPFNEPHSLTLSIVLRKIKNEKDYEFYLCV